jgi:CMP-N,N'-diacetyllegionaminic acid synthase
MKGLYIVSLIPARSGSKSIIDKNIIDFRRKPLIAHTIAQSLSSNYIDDTFVTTDSLKYQKIAQHYGAKVPFLRPSEISGDLSTDYEAFVHFINFLKEKKQKIPDIIVHLRTTYPTRKVVDINNAIELFVEKYDAYDSLRSVVKAPQTPYKMWKLDGSILSPLLKIEDVSEPYNQPRQNLPDVYWQNACIDIVKTSTLMEKESITGDNICAYVMAKNEVHDIDELIDLQRVEHEYI